MAKSDVQLSSIRGRDGDSISSSRFAFILLFRREKAATATGRLPRDRRGENVRLFPFSLDRREKALFVVVVVVVVVWLLVLFFPYSALFPNSPLMLWLRPLLMFSTLEVDWSPPTNQEPVLLVRPEGFC